MPQQTAVDSYLVAPKDCVILPGRNHCVYEHPDVEVATDLTYFIADRQGVEAKIKENRFFMLPLRMFVDFMNLLQSDKVYDGKGMLIGQARLRNLRDSLTRPRPKTRAEYFSDLFFNRDGVKHVERSKLSLDGRLETLIEPINGCSMENRIFEKGIDVEYWLSRPTPQGLPPAGIPDGRMQYVHPDRMIVEPTMPVYAVTEDGPILSCCFDSRLVSGEIGFRLARLRR